MVREVGGLWRDVPVGYWPCERASRRALDEVLRDGGARELTCCRRRGERPSRLPVPWEPEVFLSVLREG